MLYNIVLVSAIQQCESAISIHVSLPLEHPLHPHHILPLSVVTEHQVELTALYSHFQLAIFFTYASMYVSTLLFQFVPHSPSPTVSTSLFSMSASPLLPCKQVHLYHLSRFHMYASIYGIGFSLSGSLHSV